MKTILFICFLPLMNVLLAQDIKVMTYNIKYDNKRDTINNWNFRKEGMVKLMKNYDVSIMGLQECLFNQISYLDSCLTEFRYVGVGREDGKNEGEYSPILYDTTLYELLTSGTFWLSPTPDRPSKGWDAAFERVCTYGLFRSIEAQKNLWVFNTHFDHLGVEARAKSAELIIESISRLNEKLDPVILMGDFNLRPEEGPIRFIRSKLTLASDISEKPFYGPIGTFNGFEDIEMTDRIDYIFSKGLKVLTYQHIDDRLNNNKHVSDHLPVMAVFYF